METSLESGMERKIGPGSNHPNDKWQARCKAFKWPSRNGRLPLSSEILFEDNKQIERQERKLSVVLMEELSEVVSLEDAKRLKPRDSRKGVGEEQGKEAANQVSHKHSSA